MAKEKARQPMPKWLWELHPTELNSQQKGFLAYIWWCQPRGCRDWNWSLMKRFKKSRTTIKLWIKHLEDMHLVYINFPRTKHRTIYRRPYFSPLIWESKREAVKSSQQGPKTGHINTAQQKNNYKTSYSSSASQKETSDRSDETILEPSNGGGLEASCEGGYSLSEVEQEANRVRAISRSRDRAKLREAGGSRELAGLD